MNIAELMVRVSASTTDVNQKMRGVQQSLIGVERGALGTKLAFTSMNSALSSLASQMTGVNPAVATLSRTIGSFAVGGPIVAGALIGITALAKAYDLLTAGARKAAEEQKKLSDALLAAFAPKTGPNSQTAKQFNAALQERADLTKKLAQLEDDKAHPLAQGFLGQKLYDSRIEDVKKKLVELNQAIGSAMTSSIASLETVMVKGESATSKAVKQVKDLSFSLEQLRASMDEFWGPMNRFNTAFALPSVVGDMTPGAVDISDSVKIANDQAKKINDEAERHAQMIQDAIWGSARIISSTLMSALNVGGGGKGSQLGSQIGMAAGAIGGSFLGPPGAWFGGAVGSIIGSTVGSIGGSLVGGLFDNKKATDANTAAVKQNTAMMGLLLNAPSVYKVAQGRFDATQVKNFRRASVNYATRGGAPILVRP